ncbi:MAG TPA: VOC family protein [Ancylobacter sp.]
MPANPVPGDLVPFLRYADPKHAIAWLGDTFGFDPIMVIEAEDGGVAHAELRLGTSAIMLGGLKNDRLGMRTPTQAGGVTQGIYVVVPDADALWQRAVGADAEIVMDIYDTPYGSREFAVRDPEGHLWSVGTYRAGSYED